MSRWGILRYNFWISPGVTSAKADFTPCHKCSRLWNTVPESLRQTIGHTCSIGFISGEHGGHTLSLNILIRASFRNFPVFFDLCTLAPSCMNLYEDALKKKIKNNNFLWIETPWAYESDGILQNIYVLIRFYPFWTKFHHQVPVAVDGCPHHNTFRLLLGSLNILRCEPRGCLLLPTANQTTRSCLENLFIAENYLLPPLNCPIFELSRKFYALQHVFLCQKWSFDSPSVHKPHLFQKSSCLGGTCFCRDLKKKQKC